jgi:hypothetical protein
MVVGGYDDLREVLDPNTNTCVRDENGLCKVRAGPTNDVEILSLGSVIQISTGQQTCTNVVNKLFGVAYINGTDELGIIVENEAELLGLTGYFSKDAAIVCGGINGHGEQAKCYEWDPNVNQ